MVPLNLYIGKYVDKSNNSGVQIGEGNTGKIDNRPDGATGDGNSGVQIDGSNEGDITNAPKSAPAAKSSPQDKPPPADGRSELEQRVGRSNLAYLAFGGVTLFGMGFGAAVAIGKVEIPWPTPVSECTFDGWRREVGPTKGGEQVQATVTGCSVCAITDRHNSGAGAQCNYGGLEDCESGSCAPYMEITDVGKNPNGYCQGTLRCQ